MAKNDVTVADRKARRFAGIDQPEEVGRIAAERVIRRLGAKKVDTQKVPVIFEPRTARSLLDHIFDAIDGRSIYRSASFLAGKLGEKIAADNVTIIDDGTLPGLMGTSPFELPPATNGRRPIRLQMRTGFSGPSSKNSILDL